MRSSDARGSYSFYIFLYFELPYHLFDSNLYNKKNRHLIQMRLLCDGLKKRNENFYNLKNKNYKKCKNCIEKLKCKKMDNFRE